MAKETTEQLVHECSKGQQSNDQKNHTVKPHAWLDEHGDYLYRYALSRVHHEDLAADIVQETLLAGLRGYKRFSGHSTVRTWLIGIMKHKIIDNLRKEIRIRNLIDAIEHDPTAYCFSAQGHWGDTPQAWYDNPEHLCRNAQFKEVLAHSISLLPYKQQVVFNMREIFGHDTSTICEACDISIAHCHVLLHRARMSLRRSLQDYWFEEECV